MLESLKIRCYKDSDKEECKNLWIELTKYHQDIYEDPAIGGENPSQGFFDQLEKYGKENFWIALVEGETVGLVGLIVRGSEAEVEPVIVSSSHRKKGIGKRLLQHVIKHAKESGIKYLSIRPVARNKDAMRVFHELGFNVLGHIELFMSLKEDEIKKWKKSIKIHDQSFEY